MNRIREIVCRVLQLSILFGLASFVSSAMPQDGTITEEQFLKEAPKRWLEYLHGLDNKEARIQRHATLTGQRHETVDEDYTFQFSYPCMSTFFSSHHIENYNKKLLCTGRKYEFELKLVNEEPKDWMIDRYAPLEGDSLIVGARKSTKEWRFPPIADFNRSDMVRDRISETAISDLGVGLYIDGPNNTLYNFFVDGKAKILEFEDVSSQFDNIPAIRISFEYQWESIYDGLDDRLAGMLKVQAENNPEEAQTWKPLHVTGNVILISRYLLISEGSFHFEHIGRVAETNVKIDYKDLNAFPLPVRKVSKIKHVLSDGYIEDEGEVLSDIHDRADKSDAPFRLSGYGFPEPDIDQDSTTLLRRVFLCGIGILCVAIGVWIAHKRLKEDKQGA